MTELTEGDTIFTEFKGALAEQFVMQQLLLRSDLYVGYWTNERSTSEVDFIIQEGGSILPIEVKSGTITHSKCFRLFCEKFIPTRAVRVSLLPYRKEKWMENVPMYAIL